MKEKRFPGRLRRDSGRHRRIRLTALVLGFLAFVPPVLRLHSLMLRQGDVYRRLALDNQTRITRITPERGKIYDRNMNVLACSKTVQNVFLNPQELRQSRMDLESLSRELGEMLNRDPDWIRQQGQDLSRRYKKIAGPIGPETAGTLRRYLNENRLSGVHLEPESSRVYPYGGLASQVLGFVNRSGTGCEGLEASYNSFLEGGAGQVVTTKGSNEMDMPYSYEAWLGAKPGANLILTLDAQVQRSLENQLQAAIWRYDVKNGAFGMVMNVKTGEILAMATLGGYDPNRYLEIGDPALRQLLEQQKKDAAGDPEKERAWEKALQEARLRQWRNRCISDGYEPGSTFKVLTMAAALDSGAIDLNTDFYCGGSEQIPGRAQKLHCWRHQGHGAEKTAQAIQNSCNIAFAHIALKMGGKTFYEYVKKFGIMERTGIDLAGESKGIFFDRELVENTEKWGTASLTSGSFGQTFKLTPIQLVRAIASVVNGGVLMEPYLVSQAEDGEGKLLFSQEPTPVRRVLKPETSRTMCSLLESVVREGTARNANVYGYRIGGKTGTSEKIDIFDDKGRRVQDKIVSFAGLAPMENPEYIVLVALDTPSRTSGIYISGGVMAAPTVGAVLEEILPYLGVAPQYPEEDPEGKRLLLPDLRGKAPEEAKAALRELGLDFQILGEGKTVLSQLPWGNQTVSGRTQVLMYLEKAPAPENVRVPDFLGMNRQQAHDAAGRLGLTVLCRGCRVLTPQVTATAQSIPKDQSVPGGTVIEIEFTDREAPD